MTDKIDQLQVDTTESKDATALDYAYAEGFFDNLSNVSDVATHLSKEKDLYKEDLDEFFLSNPNRIHRERFEAHLPTSALVLQNLKTKSCTVQIGKKIISIDHTASSIHFIRWLIQLVEKTSKNTGISSASLVTGTSRTSITEQYKSYLMDFVDQFDPPFDKVYYMREQRDKDAFQQNYAHQLMYKWWGKSFEEFKQGTDIADGAQLAEKVRLYCVNHPEERVMLYLWGHGWKDGSMKFDAGFDAEISKELFDELVKIPNLTLEVDSCVNAEKLRGNEQKVEWIMANSEFDNATSSYEWCLFEAQSWITDMSALKEKYANLPELLKEFRLSDDDYEWFLATHHTDKNIWFLDSLEKYQTKFYNESWYISNISVAIRTSTKQEILETTNQLTIALEAYTREWWTSSLNLELVNPDTPWRPFLIPVEFLISLLNCTSYQHGDYNKDGKVSYGEARLYAMENYKPFLPTVYRSQKNITDHPYIKISDANWPTVQESDWPNQEQMPEIG